MGRDTTSFTANITASLKLCDKNAIVNENSLLYEIARASLQTTYVHAINPVLTSITQSFFAKSAKQNAQVATDTKPLSKQELKQRRIDAELASLQLNNQFESIQTQINRLLDKKKIIDSKEDENKDKGITPLLSDNDLRQRISLLEQIDNLKLEKVILSKGLIQEHALKRLDIMFLQMIALYKKNVVVTKGKTDRQHGKGSKSTGTAACHASLIPAPMLEPIPAVPSSLSRIRSLHSLFYSRCNTSTINTNTLKNSYLYDLSNITHELSNIVNEFDCHLEGKWIKSNAVQASIHVLNKVATGELTPIDGINQFGMIMNTFFMHIEYRYVLPELAYSSTAQVQSPKAFIKVWEYQRQATLSMFNIKSNNNHGTKQHNEVTIKPEYINLMLNLNSLTTAEYLVNFIYSGPIEKCIMEKQQEIWDSPSEYSNKLRK